MGKTEWLADRQPQALSATDMAIVDGYVWHGCEGQDDQMLKFVLLRSWSWMFNK